MSTPKEELEKKKSELAELKKSGSKANCVSVNSSVSEVTRNIRIEELEDEIHDLESKVKK